MKKILSVLLFAILFVSIITGCEQDNTASAVAKNLDNNLNNLTVAVNKLDSIDNKYLYNPDIYSSLSTPSGTQNNKYFALAFNDIETTPIANESVKQILIDKITDKLLSQNTTTGNCYTCKKYCDENGNCYYTDCNGNNYCYDNTGNCYSCDSIPSSCEYIGQRNISCESCEDDSILTAEQISTTNNIDSNETVDNNTILNNTENVIEEDDSIENSSETNLNTPSPSVRMFYFTQDSFSPVKLKYNPRYINQYNESTINDQIESYLFKVQKLYAMSEDSIEANTILQNCKQNIIDCIKEIRDLNICIINGECEPSIQELQALSNYIEDIKTTTRRLKDCNGELNSEIHKISETNANVMINSVDVMNSNYMRLLNHIDTRITYHKSAIATLEQIKYLLDSAINGNNISEEEIEDIIENFSIEQETPDVPEQTETDTEINSDDIIDNESNYDDVLDDEDNLNDSTLNNETNNNESNIADNETIEDNNVFNDTESENGNTYENVEEDSYTTDQEIINEETLNESSNTDSNESIKVDDENDNTTNSWSNIDTYKDNNTSGTENVENENNIDTEVYDNNIVDDNNTVITTENENNEIIDNNSTDNDNYTNVDDNNINKIDNDTLSETDSTINNNNADDTLINNGVVNGTTNNGVYQNSVITQNNLNNNNNGYGGYYYTADGEIKNNGMNNNNEIGNNGKTIENNLNRNNNVNTYGYNTLLDMINQGTVNNGINTL